MSNPWGIPGFDMSDLWGMKSNPIPGLVGPMGGAPYTFSQPPRPFGQPQRAAFYPVFTGGGGDGDFGNSLLGLQGTGLGPQNPWAGYGSGSNPGAGGGGPQPARCARSIASSLPSGSRPGRNSAAAGSAHSSRHAAQGVNIPPVVGDGSRGGERSIHVGESATSRPPGSVAGSRASRRSRASRNPGTVVSGVTLGDGPGGLHERPGMQAQNFNVFGFPRGRRGRRGVWD